MHEELRGVAPIADFAAGGDRKKVESARWKVENDPLVRIGTPTGLISWWRFLSCMSKKQPALDPKRLASTGSAATLGSKRVCFQAKGAALPFERLALDTSTAASPSQLAALTTNMIAWPSKLPALTTNMAALRTNKAALFSKRLAFIENQDAHGEIGSDFSLAQRFSSSDAAGAMMIANSDDAYAVSSFHTDVVIQFSRGYRSR